MSQCLRQVRTLLIGLFLDWSIRLRQFSMIWILFICFRPPACQPPQTMMSERKAVFFDAAGTLLRAHPSVGAIYAKALEKWG
jgi:hypothetical protein